MKVPGYYTDDGERVMLPGKWEICGTCEGHGKHSRGVESEGGGITQSEWDDWDCEERAAYFSGAYDRRCEDCRGDGKCAVVDVDCLTPEELQAWDAYCREAAAFFAEQEAERRAGC